VSVEKTVIILNINMLMLQKQMNQFKVHKYYTSLFIFYPFVMEGYACSFFSSSSDFLIVEMPWVCSLVHRPSLIIGMCIYYLFIFTH